MAIDDNGLTPDRPGTTEAGPDPSASGAVPTTVVQPSRVQYPRVVDPRRVLWRDSATILVVVVIALLGVQAFFPQNVAAPSDTSIPSGINVGSLPPGVTLAPGQTLGPIIDPSLGIDATPTPIPVITLGPSPSPSPSPSASPKPSTKPTTKPSGGPSAPPPTPNPTPVDTPVPTPAPVADFTWSETVPCVVDFANTSTGDTSWDWSFGDATSSSAQNPSHLYAAAMDYPVSLTINGSTTSPVHTVTVVGPCP